MAYLSLAVYFVSSGLWKGILDWRHLPKLVPKEGCPLICIERCGWVGAAPIWCSLGGERGLGLLLHLTSQCTADLLCPRRLSTESRTFRRICLLDCFARDSRLHPKVFVSGANGQNRLAINVLCLLAGKGPAS